MKIQIDDSYYITSDSYNPAILVKFGINKENGKTVELRRWYRQEYFMCIVESQHEGEHHD